MRTPIANSIKPRFKVAWAAAPKSIGFARVTPSWLKLFRNRPKKAARWLIWKGDRIVWNAEKANHSMIAWTKQFNLRSLSTLYNQQCQIIGLLGAIGMFGDLAINLLNQWLGIQTGMFYNRILKSLNTESLTL